MKLPRWIKSYDEKVVDDQLFAIIEFRTWHPGFLWVITKDAFTNYRWWIPRFWVHYITFIIKCLTGRV